MFVRELPRIVPPRGRIPRIDSIVSGSWESSSGPPAVLEADHLIAVPVDRLAHDGADDSVQPWAVAPTGEDPNTHPRILTAARSANCLSEVSARPAAPTQRVLARTAASRLPLHAHPRMLDHRVAISTGVRVITRLDPAGWGLTSSRVM